MISVCTNFYWTLSGWGLRAELAINVTTKVKGSLKECNSWIVKTTRTLGLRRIKGAGYTALVFSDRGRNVGTTGLWSSAVLVSGRNLVKTRNTQDSRDPGPGALGGLARLASTGKCVRYGGRAPLTGPGLLFESRPDLTGERPHWAQLRGKCQGTGGVTI